MSQVLIIQGPVLKTLGAWTNNYVASYQLRITLNFMLSDCTCVTNPSHLLRLMLNL